MCGWRTPANGMLLDRVQLVRPAHSSHHCDAQGAQGVKGLASRARVAAPSRILSDCTYKWERTVMGFSVRTAETVKATPPYYWNQAVAEATSVRLTRGIFSLSRRRRLTGESALSGLRVRSHHFKTTNHEHLEICVHVTGPLTHVRCEVARTPRHVHT